MIEPAAMSADDLDKFQSNLRAVLGFIKYSDDSDALDSFLLKEKSLQDLDKEAARVIGMCTNIKIVIDENSEVVNVCKAVQDMQDKARQEGRLEGRQEGRQDGKKEMAFKLHDENGFSFEKIASIASESLSTVQQWFAERSSAVN